MDKATQTTSMKVKGNKLVYIIYLFAAYQWYIYTDNNYNTKSNGILAVQKMQTKQ